MPVMLDRLAAPERHFNQIEAGLRALASTWMLAGFGVIAAVPLTAALLLACSFLPRLEDSVGGRFPYRDPGHFLRWPSSPWPAQSACSGVATTLCSLATLACSAVMT